MRFRGVLALAFFLLGSLVLLFLTSGSDNTYTILSFEKNGYLNKTRVAPNRKLLRQVPGREDPERMWGERCTKADIMINQGPTAPLPNGIPIYTVEIMNVCSTGCDISGIHLNCGWFTSARLISPRVFKRIRYNDCLLNAGKPLVNGDTISFQYANTFLYPLSVSSVVCH